MKSFSITKKKKIYYNFIIYFILLFLVLYSEKVLNVFFLIYWEEGIRFLIIYKRDRNEKGWEYGYSNIKYIRIEILMFVFSVFYLCINKLEFEYYF